MDLGQGVSADLSATPGPVVLTFRGKAGGVERTAPVKLTIVPPVVIVPDGFSPAKGSVLVRDNGTGMSEDVRDRIFEPFFTTKADTRGYGLGLAATREIVAELDGTIAVESQSGIGTTFTVWLPLWKKPPSKHELAESAA